MPANPRTARCPLCTFHSSNSFNSIPNLAGATSPTSGSLSRKQLVGKSQQSEAGRESQGPELAHASRRRTDLPLPLNLNARPKTLPSSRLHPLCPLSAASCHATIRCVTSPAKPILPRSGEAFRTLKSHRCSHDRLVRAIPCPGAHLKTQDF